MPALHRIHQQQQLLLIAQRAQPQQILRRRRRHAALALHALDQNRTRRRRNRLAHRGQIIERHVPKPRHQRLETLFHLLLPRRRDARQRAPVKRIHRGENFKTPLLVPKFARQFVKPLIRLRAAVAEKNLARRKVPRELLRQSPLRLVIIKIRDVNQLPRLLEQRLRDLRVAVPERTHRDPAAEIEIPLAVHIPHVTPRAARKREFEAPVAGHDILVEKLPDALELVLNNRRR